MSSDGNSSGVRTCAKETAALIPDRSVYILLVRVAEPLAVRLM